MVLLRLVVPRDYWLVVVLAQNERYHGRSDAQRFRFWCLMLDGQVRKRFFNDLSAFLAKRSSKVGFGEKLIEPFSS
jgi:hypothetical protein